MAGTGQPIRAATRCVALLNTDLHWVLSVREADGEPKAGDEHVVLCGRGPLGSMLQPSKVSDKYQSPVTEGSCQSWEFGKLGASERMTTI